MDVNYLPLKSKVIGEAYRMVCEAALVDILETRG